MRGDARPFGDGLLFFKCRNHYALYRWWLLDILQVGFGCWRQRRYPYISAYNSHFARVIFFCIGANNLLKALARHLDEFWLRFVEQRRTVLHTKTQNILVITGLAGRAIFHSRSLIGKAERKSQRLEILTSIAEFTRNRLRHEVVSYNSGNLYGHSREFCG